MIGTDRPAVLDVLSQRPVIGSNAVGRTRHCAERTWSAPQSVSCFGMATRTMQVSSRGRCTLRSRGVVWVSASPIYTSIARPLFQFMDIQVVILARMRRVVDEICEYVSRYDTGGRTNVASKVLGATTGGETSTDCVRQVRREALSKAPTMWR